MNKKLIDIDDIEEDELDNLEEIDDFKDDELKAFEGPMITVLGTSLQNKDILSYF